MVILYAVGDIILGDHPHFYGIGVRSAIEKNKLYIFEKVEHIFSEGDIVFGNLETVLSDYGKTKSYKSLILRGKPEFVEQLKKGHFNLINIANNHIQQHGKQCLFDTIDILQKREIRIIGLDNLQPQVISSPKGIKLGFLGYSLRPEQYEKDAIYSLADKNKIISDINRIKEKVNYIVISLHWGDEYITFPSAEQIDLAHKIIDAGADVIIGHHPHVLQPIESYNNKIIAYSLGNFVSDMYLDATKNSAILKIIFDKEGIRDCCLIPIYINNNFQPEPMADNKQYDFQVYETRELIKLLNKIDYKRMLNRCLRCNRLNYLKFLAKNKLPLSILFKIIFLALKRRVMRRV